MDRPTQTTLKTTASNFGSSNDVKRYFTPPAVKETRDQPWKNVIAKEVPAGNVNGMDMLKISSNGDTQPHLAG